MTDSGALVAVPTARGHAVPEASISPEPPALRQQLAEARDAWLARSPSPDTRSNYRRDLGQFLAFAGIAQDEPERFVRVLPRQISAWRDHLASLGLTNSSIRRKLTVLRSL